MRRIAVYLVLSLVFAFSLVVIYSLGYKHGMLDAADVYDRELERTLGRPNPRPISGGRSSLWEMELLNRR